MGYFNPEVGKRDVRVFAWAGANVPEIRQTIVDITDLPSGAIQILQVANESRFRETTVSIPGNYVMTSPEKYSNPGMYLMTSPEKYSNPGMHLMTSPETYSNPGMYLMMSPENYLEILWKETFSIVLTQTLMIHYDGMLFMANTEVWVFLEISSLGILLLTLETHFSLKACVGQQWRREWRFEMNAGYVMPCPWNNNEVKTPWPDTGAQTIRCWYRYRSASYLNIPVFK